jgi:hypothetical protein
MKVEVKREKESNRIAGVIEWREVLAQTKKKHPVWWGREKVGGGGSQLRDYLLPRRLAFQFYYIQRALPTQRDDDNNNNNTKTSSGFSPLAIYPFMCVLFYSYTDRHRAAAQSAQGCFFFCTRGNPAGKTRESFEMIRDGPRPSVLPSSKLGFLRV